MSARLLFFIGLLFAILRTTDLCANDIPEIVRKAKPAVVEIITADSHGNMSTGTGFFITSEGLLLTNYHVIKDARTVGARTPSGAYYPFSGEWTRLPNVDIAMLKFNANDVSYLQLDSSVQVEEGQRVLVIGSPEGLEGTVSDV
jgi:S1-C subfamily serine protease